MLIETKSTSCGSVTERPFMHLSAVGVYLPKRVNMLNDGKRCISALDVPFHITRLLPLTKTPVPSSELQVGCFRVADA